jgi:hypothetical protein
MAWRRRKDHQVVHPLGWRAARAVRVITLAAQAVALVAAEDPVDSAAGAAATCNR